MDILMSVSLYLYLRIGSLTNDIQLAQICTKIFLKYVHRGLVFMKHWYSIGHKSSLAFLDSFLLQRTVYVRNHFVN